jgi:hypothetical protein
MPERRRRPELDPRWLTIGEAAQYLGHAPSWLSPERLARLQETGFPTIDPILQRIDRDAINKWSDRRNGLIPERPPEPLAPSSASVATASENDDPWVRAARVRG